MGELLLRPLVGDTAFAAMVRDPAAFVRAFDGREPWQFQVDALRQVLERDASGKFLKPVAVVSWPRQDSKSTLSAWAALWRFFCDDTCETIVSVALDRASAGIIIGDARRCILGSDLLMSCIDADYGLTRDEIRLRDGRRWLIKSADAVFSRGLRPSTVCFDELGWSKDSGALFEVLSAAQAAQVNPMMLVTSTVSAVQAGPLWSLFEAADRQGADGSIRLLYSQTNQSPLVSAAYLERQRELMPPHVFAREHLNTWSAGSDAFCTDKDWRRCTGEIDPRRDSDPGPGYAFVDLGWSHDATAIAVARTNPEDIADILVLETFRGSHEQPVILSAVRSRIEELVVRLGVVQVVIESPQGLGLSQELQVSKSCTVTVLYPTATSNRERWGALYTALREGTVHLPPDPMLRRELLTLSIAQSATGWRVDDVPSVHNDRSVAVAGALYACQQGAVSKWVHMKFMAIVGDGVGIVSRDGELVALVDDDAQAFRALSQPRRVRIRQLAMSGVRPETLRVQFGLSQTVLQNVLDEAGYRLPDPEEAR